MDRLDAYIPYLINRAGSRIAVAFDGEIRALGVNLQQWRVLAALREADGRRPGELARLTSINLSTLSRVLDGMEAAGMVRRAPDPVDSRGVRVTLTSAGARAAERIIPIADRYEQVALHGFSPADAERLRNLLRRVYANLERADDQAVDVHMIDRH